MSGGSDPYWPWFGSSLHMGVDMCTLKIFVSHFWLHLMRNQYHLTAFDKKVGKHCNFYFGFYVFLFILLKYIQKTPKFIGKYIRRKTNTNVSMRVRTSYGSRDAGEIYNLIWLCQAYLIINVSIIPASSWCWHWDTRAGTATRRKASASPSYHQPEVGAQILRTMATFFPSPPVLPDWLTYCHLPNVLPNIPPAT